MVNRERRNELKNFLSDDEQYILEQKVKASSMRSKSSFFRHQIVYVFVMKLLKKCSYTPAQIVPVNAIHNPHS